MNKTGNKLFELNFLFLAVILLMISFVAVSCSDSENDNLDGDLEDGEAETEIEDDALIDGDDDTSENPIDGDMDSEQVEEEEEAEVSATFRFVAMADTHIIDDYYVGPEGSELDTETIYKTKERFENARSLINSYTKHPIELVFIAGDFVHNYPKIDGYDNTDLQTYRDNYTRFDIAKEIADGFNMPVYPGMGNHDYDVGDIPREVTNQLYKEKYGIDPYYKVDHKGWRFIHANNYLGETCNPESDLYNSKSGSFGKEQLEWMESLLADNMPTVIFLHHPVAGTSILEPQVDKSFHDLLKNYEDSIKLVVAGHVHMYLDFQTDYGPQHWSVGSTRYDGDAFFIIEANSETGEYSIVNRDCFQILGSITVPFDEEKGCLYTEETE